MSAKDNNADSTLEKFRETFTGLLAFDIILALQRMTAKDDQATRRDYVRTVFAAIEGWILEYRQRVQEDVGIIRNLSSAEEAVFAEKTFTLTEEGKLREQTRFFPVTSVFRFATRLVEQAWGEPIVDFSSKGWQQFIAATAIRNRVTHPKCTNDLSISTDEIAIVQAAYEWLLTAIFDVESRLKTRLTIHLKTLTEVVQALKAGDPTMLELYNKALDGENS
jgi:hypothetical protein